MWSFADHVGVLVQCVYHGLAVWYDDGTAVLGDNVLDTAFFSNPLAGAIAKSILCKVDTMSV